MNTTNKLDTVFNEIELTAKRFLIGFGFLFFSFVLLAGIIVFFSILISFADTWVSVSFVIIFAIAYILGKYILNDAERFKL